MTTVLTRPDVEARHGSRRTRWRAVLGIGLTALGLTLASVGAAFFLVAPALVTLTQPDPARMPGQAPGAGAATLPPFVAEPQVVLAEAPPEPHRATSAPRAVVVPKLGINSPVITSKVKKGVLHPPDDPRTLGWWHEGAKPGAVTGGALITGHTVSTGGGALDDLETLRKGDAVRVVTAKGRIDYKVTGVTIYRKSTLAKDAQKVFSQTVPGRLVLITCEDWNGHSYDSNAIVFAEVVTPRDRRSR